MQATAADRRDEEHSLKAVAQKVCIRENLLPMKLFNCDFKIYIKQSCVACKKNTCNF